MCRVLVFCIRGYQLLVAPILANACRFHPSCSVYAVQALEKYGLLKGIFLGLSRLMRCHPLHPGGYDPA